MLKVPHHGSSRQDQTFLAATHARLAIASAGVDNDYGHPAPGTVARLRALGMQVVATNEHGGVAVEASGTAGSPWRPSGEDTKSRANRDHGRLRAGGKSVELHCPVVLNGSDRY